MAKILLIEDDLSIAKLYKTELELDGHNVTHLENGAKTVDTAKAETPDIILLDIQLPDKDGLTILADLKDDELTKNIKVVMLTNYANEENVEKALNMGAEDFIPKHRIVPQELSAKVNSMV
ncbi:response regulator [bacterium]|nr:response regulator [bacterium]